jgi:flagellar biosynthesis protein FlhG
MTSKENKMQSVQATGLKRSANPGPVQVIAVTGGKGGVGKTSVAVNLATALGSTGKRVLLLDGDLGLANVDVFLGLSPRHTMAQVLTGERSLEEIIVESPYGVNVVPGASGVAELANLPAAAHLQLVQAFSALSARVDTLIVDTSAGIAHSVVQFSQAAQHVIVVVCDEPASLTDAYGLIKVLCRRQPGCRFEIVANRVESAAHGRELNEKLMRVCHRFLGITPSYLGYLPEDDYVRQAIRGQATVVEAFPSSPAARAFQRLARAIDAWEAPAHARGGVEFFMERLVQPSTQFAAGVQ